MGIEEKAAEGLLTRMVAVLAADVPQKLAAVTEIVLLPAPLEKFTTMPEEPCPETSVSCASMDQVYCVAPGTGATENPMAVAPRQAAVGPIRLAGAAGAVAQSHIIGFQPEGKYISIQS